MQHRAIRVPHLVAALAVPACFALLIPPYASVMSAAGGYGAGLPRISAVTLTVLGAYAGGCVLWTALRRWLPRDIARVLAHASFAVGLAVTLFSFGYRTGGELLLLASIGGLVVSLPQDPWGSRITLAVPGRRTLLYWMLTLELPALAALALSVWGYAQGADSATVIFGTTFYLILTYLFGFAGWSVVRAYTPVWALFGATFFALFGLASAPFLASLGPPSLIAPCPASAAWWRASRTSGRQRAMKGAARPHAADPYRQARPTIMSTHCAARRASHCLHLCHREICG